MNVGSNEKVDIHSKYVRTVRLARNREYSADIKGAEATLTQILAKNSNTLFFLQQPLPTLPQIML